MNKLTGSTPDLTRANIEKIAELFPAVMTESGGEDGAPARAIDFDLLRQTLSGALADGPDERYRLDWPGKRASLLKANTPIKKTLRPDHASSVDFDTTENVFIEGDNFEALKILQESYLGKVKMIYIDPPYNTGKDFVYSDNFTQDKADYDEEIEAVDDEGNKMFKENTRTNPRFHSDWLSMMYERLTIARDFLNENGVIFISIDDNEVHNLRQVCNEVYGEANYLTTLHIQVRYSDKSINEEKPFKPLLEHILVYAKDGNVFEPNRSEEAYTLEKFIYKIKENAVGEEIMVGNNQVTVFKQGEWGLVMLDQGDEKQLKETWISGSIYSTMSYGKVFQKVVEPRIELDGLGSLYKVHGRGDDGLGYRYYTGPAKKGAKRGKMYSGVPLKRVEEINSELGSVRLTPIPTFFDYSAEFGNIRHEGGTAFNSGKKPVDLLCQLLGYHKEKNIIVLDFFAGSASTAHAVIRKNIEDGGNRKFIMVQLAESVQNNVEYENIAQISRERIRRAAAKIKVDYAEQLTAREVPLDTGFRAYTVADSVFLDVEKHPSELEQAQLLDLANNIKADRTPADLLTQVMLELGLTLDLQIETKIVGVNTVFYVAGNSLVACFDAKVPLTLIDEIAKCQPLRVAFKDASFGSDDDLINAETHLKRLSPDTILSVI